MVLLVRLGHTLGVSLECLAPLPAGRFAWQHSKHYFDAQDCYRKVLVLVRQHAARVILNVRSLQARWPSKSGTQSVRSRSCLSDRSYVLICLEDLLLSGGVSFAASGIECSAWAGAQGVW